VNPFAREVAVLKKRFMLGFGGSVVALLAGTGIFLAGLQILGNFHEVVPGQYYRSAQPTAAQIADYARKYGIKSVLNLRGENSSATWYKEEVAEAAKLGLKHVDFRMSARRGLTTERARELIALLHDLPKPILVHCKSGSDRSGLVSAIYVFKIAGQGEEAAERQISLRYGHIGIPYLSEAFAMDESWEDLEVLFGLTAENGPRRT
jgi:protein tyrosine/serine phosphatase